ncbi:MAG TPA: hypothetical protein VGH86_10350 [Phenylobacterium sp.]|jgi:hypothetical protein
MDKDAKAASLAKLAQQRATFVATMETLSKAGIPDASREGFEKAMQDALAAFDRLKKSLDDA